MTLAAGFQLGRYEILGPLGAGGMGEVYRARDPRLDRDVAIKVLPSSLAGDVERLRRFEQEAKAAGGLNHPNILSVFDIATHDGAPYLVSELLEGETLRSRLGGTALAPRRAIEYALQIAQGLSAAHEKGIVHRDLKPDNLFVTKDGRVKILDFGLAKLTRPDGGGDSRSDSPTRTAGTDAGTVLGTAGYMSPEQVRGKPSDHRSDIFSFGAILYEMLSGRRAFHGDTAADTMTAILKEDPPELSATRGGIAPGLERIVRHCLEKNPEGRFQSARDLAFDLEALSTGSGGESAATARGAARSRRLATLTAVGLAAVAIGAGLFLVGRRSGRAAVTGVGTRLPTFKRVTFGRGNVLTARFAPGWKNVVYGAAWEGRPSEIFLTLGDAAESRPLGLPSGDLLSVSSSGELAIQLAKQVAFATGYNGTLARVPLGGGAPREILEGVALADWAPDGKSLAVVRSGGRGQRVEFPLGTPLYETAETVISFRVSPRGDQVALLEQQNPSFDFSYSLPNAVVVVDRSGKRTEVASWMGNSSFLAWSPSGEEIWFPASEGGKDGYLFAVTLSGRKRVVLQVPGTLTIHDIAPDGRVLLEQDIWQTGTVALGAGAARERDLSWLGQSQVADLSADGRSLLFTETGEGGGAAGAVYLRGTDGSPAVRLGEGIATALSPDGHWAITIPRTAPTQLVLLPTGTGEARSLGTQGLNYVGAAWFPDGKKILASGYEAGRGIRAYVEDVAGAAPRPITPEGLAGHPVLSPDGRRLAVAMNDGRFLIYPVDGSGEPRTIPGIEPGESLSRWSADDRSFFVCRLGQVPARVFRVDIATGRRELWKELVPADASGLMRIDKVVVSPDGQSYAYFYERVLYSNLYIAEGLR